MPSCAHPGTPPCATQVQPKQQGRQLGQSVLHHGCHLRIRALLLLPLALLLFALLPLALALLLALLLAFALLLTALLLTTIRRLLRLLMCRRTHSHRRQDHRWLAGCCCGLPCCRRGPLGKLCCCQ